MAATRTRKKPAAKARKAKARPAASKAKTGKAKARPAASKAPGREARGAVHLRKVIEDLIEAKGRGDLDAKRKAAAALAGFRKAGSPEVRLAAVRAEAVANHDVAVDSQRMLGEIAAGLR